MDDRRTCGCTWESMTWTGSGEGRVNEDWALVDAAHGCAVLVDGATGLTKVNLVPGTSDAAWYARTLSEQIVDRISEPDASVADALVEAGRATAEAYRRFPGATELERIDEPNGSLTVLRWDDDSVEVWQLGDCTAVVTMRDGRTELLHDATLTALDDENYERMYRHATKHGTTMAEARRALNPRFIENRLKMNEPGGYWAADISCRGMTHALSWRFPRDEVESLFACSDGYAACVDMEVVADEIEMARRVHAGGGKLLGEELRGAEQADAGCWKHHRSKTSDDATYVAIRLA